MKFKRIIFSLLFLVTLTQWCDAQKNNLWTVGTAKQIPYGQADFGVFMPLRYGWKPDMELSGHPLLFFVLPNINLKKTWFMTEKSVWVVSTKHGLNYPSLFLNLLEGNVSTNVIDKNAHFPPILAMKNELLVSYLLEKATTCTPPNYLLTLKLGFKKAVRYGDSVPTVNYPVAFQETQIYKQKTMYYIGADLEAHWDERFNYCVDIDICKVGTHFAIQHKALLVYPMNERFTFVAGYWAAFAPNPSSKDVLFMPVIDVLYKLVKQKIDDHKLFDKKMF